MVKAKSIGRLQAFETEHLIDRTNKAHVWVPQSGEYFILETSLGKQVKVLEVNSGENAYQVYSDALGKHWRDLNDSFLYWVDSEEMEGYMLVIEQFKTFTGTNEVQEMEEGYLVILTEEGASEDGDDIKSYLFLLEANENGEDYGVTGDISESTLIGSLEKVVEVIEGSSLMRAFDSIRVQLVKDEYTDEELENHWNFSKDYSQVFHIVANN